MKIEKDLVVLTKEIIENAPDLSRIRAGLLAESFGYSDGGYCDLLQREGGIKFSHLLEAERKKRCVELINSDKPVNVKSISKACGFTNTASASRCFKKWFGFYLMDFKNNPDLQMVFR